MKILAVLFDAGDILYSKPRRKAAIANFLTTRGYSRPETNDPKEKEMRSQAHAGIIYSAILAIGPLIMELPPIGRQRYPLIPGKI